MRCDDVQPWIDALVDGELPVWSATRVRNHLRSCPACRADFDATQRLTRQAQAWRAVPAPARLGARINGLVSPQSQEDSAMSFIEVFPHPISDKQPLHGRTLRWQTFAAAGAAAAVLTLIGTLLFSSVLHPAVAFADVQRAMANIAAVSWTETQTRDHGGRVILHNTHRFWVRRGPPAVAEWDSASTVPQVPGEEYAGPTKSLSDAHGQIYFHAQEGIYYLHPTPGIARQVADTIDRLTAARAENYGRPERVTLDGRPTLRFHQHEPEYDVTVWADPQTLRVVRKRTEEIDHFPSGTEHIVMDAAGFQYDTPAPAGVFDLTVPPDARVTEDDGRGNKTLVVGAPTPVPTAASGAGAIPSVLTVVAMHPRGSSLMPAGVSTSLGHQGIGFAIAVREPVSRARQLEAFAARAGHEFLLVSPGRPAVRATLSGLTAVDTDGHGGAFRGFGLRVVSGDERKIVWKPATTYTLRPINTGHANRWAVDNSRGDVVLHFGGG